MKIKYVLSVFSVLLFMVSHAEIIPIPADAYKDHYSSEEERQAAHDLIYGKKDPRISYFEEEMLG